MNPIGSTDRGQINCLNSLLSQGGGVLVAEDFTVECDLDELNGQIN
jgi:hypothetical protein